MLSSRRTKISNSDIAGGESIFDFLKRKKRVSLQNSLIQSRKQQSDISLSVINLKQDEVQPSMIQTTRNLTHRKNPSDKITPKKVTFADSEQKKQTARTFIDIISPLKSKQSRFYDKHLLEEESKQNNKQITKSNVKNKSIEKEHTRKQLNKTINVMKQTILKLIRVGKGLKQKAHFLFIDMKPVFKLLQQTQNKTMKKKIQQSKQRLRTMQHQFSQLDVQNANQIVESFHKTLSEHLISLQAKNKALFQKSQMDSVTRLRNEKDTKIQELQDLNEGLQKNVNILERKIQKLQNNISHIRQQYEARLENQNGNSQQRFISLQTKINQLENNKLKLEQKIKDLQKEGKQKQKKIRDLAHANQIMQRKFLQKCEMQKTTRQQFLVNEILILKQQFQKDMNQLSQLYATKQQDQNLLIQQQKRQIAELKHYCQMNKQGQKRNNTDAQNLKLILNKYRKQNQCLVSDMHRLNQELYQHWLALKDIKVLATRLHILPKFSRIYQDLAFNDMLFS